MADRLADGPCALRRKCSELSGNCSPGHLSCSISLVSRLYLISSCNAIRFYFLSKLLDLLLAGMDRPHADQPNQPNNLAECLPV
eukprot:1145463-Pelagomonas_calceolata.AAC.3